MSLSSNSGPGTGVLESSISGFTSTSLTCSSFLMPGSGEDPATAAAEEATATTAAPSSFLIEIPMVDVVAAILMSPAVALIAVSLIVVFALESIDALMFLKGIEITTRRSVAEVTREDVLWGKR